jgi:hypothetical protein
MSETSPVSDLVVPDFGALLGAYIGQVPVGTIPRFLALLERTAADRYRSWAEVIPEHAAILLQCAADEDEIADRIEAAFALDPTLREQLEAPLPAAKQTYYEAFSPYDVWDQLRMQADAERQGARAWRNIAARHPDPAVVEVLHSCSALEESSADAVDALIAAHAPPS